MLPNFAQSSVEHRLVENVVTDTIAGRDRPHVRLKLVGRDRRQNASHRSARRAVALWVAGGSVPVDDAVLQIAQQLAQALLFLIVQFVVQSDGLRGELTSGHLDGGGEDLCVVLLSDTVGETCGGSVIAFQRGIPDDVDDIVVNEI